MFAPQTHSGINLFRRKRVIIQSRLSVERLLNVLISVVDVMGEEECSLRNECRLYYVPWTPHVREALKEEEAKSTTWAYQGIHYTLRSGMNTAVKCLRSPASFRNYIQ